MKHFQSPKEFSGVLQKDPTMIGSVLISIGGRCDIPFLEFVFLITFLGPSWVVMLSSKNPYSTHCTSKSSSLLLDFRAVLTLCFTFICRKIDSMNLKLFLKRNIIA